MRAHLLPTDLHVRLERLLLALGATCRHELPERLENVFRHLRTRGTDIRYAAIANRTATFAPRSGAPSHTRCLAKAGGALSIEYIPINVE